MTPMNYQIKDFILRLRLKEALNNVKLLIGGLY